MKNVTLCGGSGTRSRFRLGSPKYRAVPVVKIGKCANGWNRRVAVIVWAAGGVVTAARLAPAAVKNAGAAVTAATAAPALSLRPR